MDQFSAACLPLYPMLIHFFCSGTPCWNVQESRRSEAKSAAKKAEPVGRLMVVLKVVRAQNPVHFPVIDGGERMKAVRMAKTI